MFNIDITEFDIDIALINISNIVEWYCQWYLKFQFTAHTLCLINIFVT